MAYKQGLCYTVMYKSCINSVQEIVKQSTSSSFVYLRQQLILTYLFLQPWISISYLRENSLSGHSNRLDREGQTFTQSILCLQDIEVVRQESLALSFSDCLSTHFWQLYQKLTDDCCLLGTEKSYKVENQSTNKLLNIPLFWGVLHVLWPREIRNL